MSLRERRVNGVFLAGSRFIQVIELTVNLTLILIQVRCFSLMEQTVRAKRPFFPFTSGGYGR